MAIKFGPTKGKAYINMDKILKDIAKSKGIDEVITEQIFEGVVEDYRATYEKYYKSLVHGILAHLKRGFPGAAGHANVTIAISGITSGGSISIIGGGPAGWEALSESYLNRKAGRNRAINKGRKAAGKRGLNKAANTADKFWIFKRNTSKTLSNSSRMSAGGVSIIAHKKEVKRTGVLVRGKNGFTIRYTAGLKVSTLPSPLNEMVRTPFINGRTAGTADLSEEAFGVGDNRGLHVLAIVEAKRPFIMELSGAVGRMARLRLGIK